MKQALGARFGIFCHVEADLVLGGGTGHTQLAGGSSKSAQLTLQTEQDPRGETGVGQNSATKYPRALPLVNPA